MAIRSVIALAASLFAVSGLCQAQPPQGSRTFPTVEVDFLQPYKLSNVSILTVGSDNHFNSTIGFTVSSNFTKTSANCSVSFDSSTGPPSAFGPCLVGTDIDLTWYFAIISTGGSWSGSDAPTFTIKISDAFAFKMYVRVRSGAGLTDTG